MEIFLFQGVNKPIQSFRPSFSSRVSGMDHVTKESEQGEEMAGIVKGWWLLFDRNEFLMNSIHITTSWHELTKWNSKIIEINEDNIQSLCRWPIKVVIDNSASNRWSTIFQNQISWCHACYIGMIHHDEIATRQVIAQVNNCRSK